MAYRCVRNSNYECDSCGYCNRTENEEPKKKCGTCQHHVFAADEDDWMCSNIDSECYADFTGYNDSCDEYEKK